MTTQHSILLTIPSARGIHPATFAECLNLQNEVRALGHKFYHSELYRQVLDLSRNEFVTTFMSGTTCDLHFCLDDDCQIESKHFGMMINAIDGGADIVSAPCRMRSEGNLFNVIPIKEPEVLGGTRVVECAWTGFGAVLIHRRVWAKFYEDALEKDKRPACPTCGHKERHLYRSTTLEKARSIDIFRSEVVPARRLLQSPSVPEEQNEYVLDDRAFSLKAIELGFKIHAAIDVATMHDGLRGQFSAELERFHQQQMAIAAQRAAKGRGIVGPDGRPT